jgi:predicted phosphodiesterase
MAGPSLLERRKRVARPPKQGPRVWTWLRVEAGALRSLRRGLALILVLAATLAGGYLALVSYHDNDQLSVGEIRMSVDPGHRGALDIYVPLVDWGARFEAIRAPVRIRVDLQTIDRDVAQGLAEGKPLNVGQVRVEARNALKSYLMKLFALVILSALALGILVAFAIRSRVPRLRWTSGLAVLTTVGIAVALVVLIPPRGEISNPQYYAHGPDIPRALEAVEAARRTSGVLDQELDAQLVGLARLVVAPGRRRSLAKEPVITVASDLHNNTVGLGVLERLSEGSTVFFVGDLTDRGSQLETRLVRRAANVGRRFVFVSGNHDSDYLSRELANQGATVLTQDGRMRPDGTRDGHIVTKIDGLRVAGYSDPFERRSAEAFKDRYDAAPNQLEQEKFQGWLQPLIGKVDIVMVHEPALIQPALLVLKDNPPSRPLVFLVGHTHKAELTKQPGVTVINGGSIGAGGTGNLGEPTTNLGIARFVFTLKPSFQPLAADLVSIDPGTGSSSARRERLDPDP